jgi:Protein of unknown function (DUF4058)
MPVHDWTRVDAGIFHAFHLSWLARLQDALNDGIMPEGYYALAEQHTGLMIPDVLTLYGGGPSQNVVPLPTPPAEDTGGTAVADAPPKVRRKHSVEFSTKGRRRSLAIRHVTGHRLVALLEVISPANKDRIASVTVFVNKVVSALEHGVHVLMVDLLPPSRHDPFGMHDAILQQLDAPDQPYDLPAEEPLTLASYVAGPVIDMFLEHVAVGAPLPEMPLFFVPKRYVSVPLQRTYDEAYHGMPALWRGVLEGRAG